MVEDKSHGKSGKGPFAVALERYEQLHYCVLKKWVHAKVSSALSWVVLKF